MLDASGRMRAGGPRACGRPRRAATAGSPTSAASTRFAGGRARPDAVPDASSAVDLGYIAIVFLHENGVFSAMLGGSTRPRAGRAAAERGVRGGGAAIPLLADWTDPDRSRALTAVLPGGPLLKQLPRPARRGRRVPVPGSSSPATGGDDDPGLRAGGDDVLAAGPAAAAAGRARRRPRGDTSFDAWCTAAIKPWFDDHVHGHRPHRALGGRRRHLVRPLPSDLIAAVQM